MSNNRRTITQQKAGHIVKLLENRKHEDLVMFFLDQADIRWISFIEALGERQVEILEQLSQTARDMLIQDKITKGQLNRIVSIYRSYILHLDGLNSEMVTIVLAIVESF